MSSSPATILLVNDDEATVYVTQRVLSRAGFNVVAAASGAEALAQLSPLPDLVLLDVQLPDLHGFDVCRQIRERTLPEWIPIVHMSSVYVQQDVVAEGLELGADAYLVHPVDDRSLIATLNAFLRASGERAARRAAELARLEAERESLFKWSFDLQCVMTLEGRFQRVNPAFERTLGYEPNELLGTSFLELVHPDHRSEAVAQMGRLSSGEPTLQLETRYRCKNGGYCWLSWNCVQDSAHELLYAVARDTTERKLTEQQLRMRDSAIQALQAGLVITNPRDPEDPIIYANPAFCQMTGYSLDELMGRAIRFLQGPATDEGTVASIRSSLAGARPVQCEILHYRRDGTPFWDALSISPIFDSEGKLTYWVGIHQDVTARHNLEAQLRQSQKMEAVGQLAGGVAHDFNNMLAVICGYTEILLETDPTGQLPATGRALREIRKATARASALTRQLLAFSRKQMQEPRAILPRDVVRDMEAMLRRLLGESYQLRVQVSDTRFAVKTDPNQLEQVVLNLCLNGRDAMPQGGAITLCVEDAEVKEDSLTHAGIEAGCYSVLSVRDTGVGMSTETVERIFEPFFTTKRPGEGTGLGLTIVLGIVQQAGGRILVRSEPGQGTTFLVYLPRTAERVQPQEEAAAELALGGEKILVIEDEAMVRGLVRTVLERSGYSVVVASNGEEALRLAAECGDVLDLLLTDVVIPGDLGGRAVAERMLGRWPELKVLYMSGYTDDDVLRHGVSNAEVAILQKPFTPASLVRKVQEVLHAG